MNRLLRGALAGLLLLSLGAPFAGEALAGATASTFNKKPGKPESLWSPANVIDGDPKTFWQEGVEGPGEGSWIKIDLPRSRVNQILISGGHAEDERMFQKYSRAKDISIELYSVDDDRTVKPIKQVSVTLEDKFGMQTVDMGATDIGSELFGGEMRIVIHSVYPGKDFVDTVLGEVKVVLDEYPAQLAFTSATTNGAVEKGEDVKTEVKGEAADTTVVVTKDVDVATGFEVGWAPVGSVIGQELVFEAPDYGLAAMLIDNGAGGKTKPAARPKKVQITVGSFLQTEIELEDKPGLQRIEFPYTNGYNGGHFGRITVKVLSVWGDEKAPVAPLRFRCMATNYSV